MRHLSIKNERTKGSIALIVLFSMVGMLGMGALVIDGGQLYWERARLQVAVDAAALAGARALTLGTAMAEELATSAGVQNGAIPHKLSIVIDASAGQATATAQATVTFGLARVLNITDTQISATATARVGGVLAMRGAAPLGVIWQNFVFGQQYDLKLGGGDGDTGNYGALALGGTGSSNYRDNLKFGYPSMLNTGDLIPTEPGNMSGPTRDAIQWRIDQCQHGCTFDHHVAHCTRVLFVPIIDGLPNGRGEVTILGFGSFFVEGYTASDYVRGRFIRTHVQAQPGGSNFYGLSTVRLTN